MANSVSGAQARANIKIGLKPIVSNNNKNPSTIKQTKETDSTSEKPEETFLDSADKAGPVTTVSGSQEATVGAEVSRFQEAIKTGYLGKDFTQGLADPGPYAAMSQQQQQAQQAFGGGTQQGAGNPNNTFSDWKDRGATDDGAIRDTGDNLGEGVKEDSDTDTPPKKK